MATAIEFVPIAGSLGAEVQGIDLREPLSDAVIAQLRKGWLEHQVLFFRDQPIEPAHQLALAKAFGEPIPHPAYPHVDGHPEVNILQITPDVKPKIDTWHTDMTFMPEPPLGSILRARVVPKHGGDTMWASLSAAYESLSGRMQSFLSDLHAMHSFSHGFRHTLAEPGQAERLEDTVQAHPPCKHPVVKAHPETGKKLLYVNRLFTTHIVELPPEESSSILSMLYDHMEAPELTCRFSWRPDSIAFWDNRATLHRPINDFWPAHRRMERITIRTR